MTDDHGVNVAAITPRGKHGDVDFGAAFELIDYWCAAGVRGIALFGSTGEYPALTADERTRLLYLAAKRSRAPILAGVGTASLHASVALARESRGAGAAGLLLPPPYFFQYQQDDIREFYLRFAEQVRSGGAIYLCNVPPFSSEIAVETAIALLETGLYAGIAEGSGNLESMARLQSAAGVRSFALLAGNDAIFAHARSTGAHGVVSPAACAVPEVVVALDCAIRTGNRERADRLDQTLQEFLAWVDQFPQPAIIKVATGLRGLKTGPLAVPMSLEKQKRLDEFREWFQGWQPAVKKIAANG